MSRRVVLSTLALASALAVALGAPAQVVQASTLQPAAVTHCVTDVDTPSAADFCAVGTDKQFADAYFAATRRVIADSPAEGAALLASHGVASKAVSSSVTYVVTAVWKNANFGGSVHTFISSYSNYCATHNYTYGDLDSAFWTLWPDDLGDSISSVRNGPGCQTWFYTWLDRSGSIYKVSGSAASLSWMNDDSNSLFITG